MFVSLESLFPYALDEKCVSLTSVLTSAPSISAEYIATIQAVLTRQTTKVRERSRFESLSAVDEVGKIELGDVVTDDEVRIDFLEEISPGDEEVGFLLELYHVRTNDVGAGIESEDVTDKWCALA